MTWDAAYVGADDVVRVIVGRSISWEADVLLRATSSVVITANAITITAQQTTLTPTPREVTSAAIHDPATASKVESVSIAVVSPTETVVSQAPSAPLSESKTEATPTEPTTVTETVTATTT